MTASAQLVILLKAPRVGWVKTRLAAAIGHPGATAVYRRLAACVFRNLCEWPCVELRHAPDDAGGELRDWQRPGWTLAPQGDGDLGDRLARAFAEHFQAGARKVVILGADCPDVNLADVAAAVEALETADVVLGPALDGGYWLVGLREPQPDLFRDIAWSTGQVRVQTEIRAAQAGLSLARLRTLSDVDTEEDWRLWKARQGEPSGEVEGAEVEA